MSATDDRIISMQFDNADFEQRLQSTLKGLDKLDQTIQMAGAKQGLTEISSAASKVNLSGIASSLDNISSKFSVLGAVGFSAIQKVTQGVMGMASHVASLAKTDILEPIISGGKSRATSLEHAKFMFQGLGMDVNSAMASSLAAVKGTAFGLDEAANIAAQFGASGITAGNQMTRALTGVSGVAAMTGRSFTEIGDIFAQSAGAGKVGTQDLLQFSDRGINAAAAMAKVTGKTEAQVREMASKGTLDFKTFADAMDKAFGAHATAANQTFAGSLSNLHAAMSRMGASFFSDRIVQERDLFNALSPVIDKLTAALKPLTTEMLKLSGAMTDKMIAFLNNIHLEVFSAAVKNVAKDLGEASNLLHIFLGAIHEAFKDIFPGSFVSDLASVTYFFEHLLKSLTPGPATIAKITTVFAGLFAALSIVKEVFIGLVTVVASFFGAFLGPGSHGAMNILETIAQALVRFNAAFVETGKMADFFNKIAEYAKLPAKWIKDLVDDIEALFKTTDKASSSTHALAGLTAGVASLSTVGQKLHTVIVDIGHVIDELWHKVTEAMSGIGHAIGNAFNPGVFQGALSVVSTTLLGGLVYILKKFMDNGIKVGLGGGLGEMAKGISESLGGLTGTLQSMQTKLKAETLEKIAASIGIMAAAILVLSLIKPDALQKAMSAMAFGFAQLVLVMAALNKIGSGAGGGVKISLIAASILELSGAVVILATAVRILSSLSPAELAKGLGAIAVALGMLIGATKLLSGSSIGLVAAGVALNAMATGMVILAGAMEIFGRMSWAEIGKGLVAVGGSLLIIAGVMKLMPVTSTLAAGLAMIPLATGITILAGAVKLLGTMSLAEMVKGLVGLAGGLAIIALAMHAMPLSLPVTAAGLVVVAMAIGLMVPSLKMIGNMGLGNLVKGLGGLAAMLLILAVGVNAMDGAIGGAAALVVVSGALLVLTGVLKELGELSWAQLVEGLVAIAGVLVVLGLGAAVLQPLIPALLGLGVAMTLVGAGFALFGAGAFLFAAAISMLAATSVAGVAAIVAALVVIVKAIPTFVTALVTSLSQSAVELGKAITILVQLFGQLIEQVSAMVVTQSPHIAAAIVAIITSALELIREKFPDVVQTAFDLLMSFLKALDDNLPKVIDEAAKVIVAFLTGISNNAQKIVDAAVNAITSFLAAIAKRAGDLVAGGLGVLVAFLNGVANNLDKVVTAAGNIIDKFLGALGGAYLKIIETGANVILAVISGLGKNVDKIIAAGANLIINFVTGISSNAIKIIDAAAQALVTFLNGIAAAITTYEPQIIQAGGRIMVALIKGLIDGITGSWHIVSDMLIHKAKGLLGDVLGFFGIHSPSTVFMEIGKNLSLGLAQGISSDTTATNSAVTQAEKIVKAFSDSLSSVPDSLAGMSEFNPVISPVLDLSNVRATAAGLNDLLPTPSITPDMSYSQARMIASTADLTKATPAAPTETKEITFNQTINSPDALSTNDIYKGTKSQIALAKEELGIS